MFNQQALYAYIPLRHIIHHVADGVELPQVADGDFDAVLILESADDADDIQGIKTQILDKIGVFGEVGNARHLINNAADGIQHGWFLLSLRC